MIPRLPGLLVALALASVLSGWPCAAAASGALSEATHRRLAEVHELMGEGRHGEALKRLDKIPTREGRAYERAVVLQTYGYLYAAREEYERAIEAFIRCLALDALPGPAASAVLYALAQLQVTTGDYAEAVVSLEKWLGREKQVKPEGLALGGWAYAQLGRYPRAVELLSEAIEQADEPREDWYRMLLAVYFDSEQYRAAASLLQDMVRRFPERKEYWTQLSGTYQMLGDDQASLATLELAHLRGLLSEERELLSLARYQLYMGAPEKAGRVLEAALGRGSVRSTAENWRLASDAWQRARQLPASLAALDRAIQAGGDGALHLRRARLAAEMDD